jgi:tetratricopeptide (TPR) repeat protein
MPYISLFKSKTGIALLCMSCLVLISIGTFMSFKTKSGTKIENFDDAWNLGDPIKIEQKFSELLPQAEALQNKSIYLQILSQIALTQAMQKRFDEAHKTLDKAESLLTDKTDVAYARILLERGRTFHQEALLAGKSANLPKARNLFEKSFEVSKENNFDFHTINAAHMVAIVAERPEDKIKWNRLALDCAEKTKDKRAKLWFGPLYNNLGMNFIETKQYDKALDAFQKALTYRKEEKTNANIRVAQWQIAHALRMLGKIHEALPMLEKLRDEYETMEKSSAFDMPLEMFKLTRGWVYEELAEIHDAMAKECANDLYLDDGSKDPLYEALIQTHAIQTKKFAGLALDDLSQDPMFSKTEHKRLGRLKQLLESKD